MRRTGAKETKTTRAAGIVGKACLYLGGKPHMSKMLTRLIFWFLGMILLCVFFIFVGTIGDIFNYDPTRQPMLWIVVFIVLGVIVGSIIMRKKN